MSDDKKHLKPIIAISKGQPESHYGSVHAKIVAYPACQEEDGVVYGLGNNYRYPDRAYQSLGMHTWVFSDTKSCGECKIAYRDVYEIDFDDMERMSKTMRRIRRRITQYVDKNGYVETFGHRVARFAWVLNATQVWIWQTEKTGILLKVDDAIDILNQTWENLHIDCQIKAGTYDGVVKCYTTAPADYDAFESKTIEHYKIKDKTVRVVEIEGRHYNWHVSRYQSGMHITTRTKEEMALCVG